MMNDADVHIVLGNVFFIIMVSKHETLQPPFGRYLQLLQLEQTLVDHTGTPLHPGV